MINNKEKIIPLLKFPHKDIFYFVQILQRKKDHKGVTLGGSNNNSRLIKAYYVTSAEKLEIYWEEIVKLSQLFNARASINLNPRNFEKAGFHVLQKIANQMSNGDFYSIRKAYDSVCGEYHSEIDKRWLIDIDTTDLKELERVKDIIDRIQETDFHIDKNKPDKVQRKILACIPSKNGWHIITEAFNLAAFTRECPGIEVHKNNPTNLYIP